MAAASLFPPHLFLRVPAVFSIGSTLIYVFVIVFIALLFRSAIGFGDGLFGIPMLALRLPLREVVPLALLLSITVATIIIAQDWKEIHVRSTGWLLGPTVLGLPLGVLVLTRKHDEPAKLALGLLIVAFALYSLLGRNKQLLHRDRPGWLLTCGFFSGVLAGAFGMSAPPVVVYGSLRGWQPLQFRATLQSYFLLTGLMMAVGFWIAGLWVPTVFHYYLLSLPAALLALFLGRAIHGRLGGTAFMRFVYLGLGAIGVMLMVQAITGKL